MRILIALCISVMFLFLASSAYCEEKQDNTNWGKTYHFKHVRQLKINNLYDHVNIFNGYICHSPYWSKLLYIYHMTNSDVKHVYKLNEKDICDYVELMENGITACCLMDEEGYHLLDLALGEICMSFKVKHLEAERIYFTNNNCVVVQNNKLLFYAIGDGRYLGEIDYGFDMNQYNKGAVCSDNKGRVYLSGEVVTKYIFWRKNQLKVACVDLLQKCLIWKVESVLPNQQDAIWPVRNAVCGNYLACYDDYGIVFFRISDGVEHWRVIPGRHLGIWIYYAKDILACVRMRTNSIVTTADPIEKRCGQTSINSETIFISGDNVVVYSAGRLSVIDWSVVPPRVIGKRMCLPEECFVGEQGEYSMDKEYIFLLNSKEFVYNIYKFSD